MRRDIHHFFRRETQRSITVEETPRPNHSPGMRGQSPHDADTADFRRPRGITFQCRSLSHANTLSGNAVSVIPNNDSTAPSRTFHPRSLKCDSFASKRTNVKNGTSFASLRLEES